MFGSDSLQEPQDQFEECASQLSYPASAAAFARANDGATLLGDEGELAKHWRKTLKVALDAFKKEGKGGTLRLAYASLNPLTGSSNDKMWATSTFELEGHEVELMRMLHPSLWEKPQYGQFDEPQARFDEHVDKVLAFYKGE